MCVRLCEYVCVRECVLHLLLRQLPRSSLLENVYAWLVLSNVASASLVWLIWLDCGQLGSSCGSQEEGLGGSGRGELSG